jgi:hypothetical protein
MLEEGLDKRTSLHLAEHGENSNPTLLIAVPTDFFAQILVVLLWKSFGDNFYGPFKAEKEFQ